jgi:hypothetical protein
MYFYRDHKTYAQHRLAELRQQAAQERLAEEVDRRVVRFYHPALAQVGRWLIASGYQLQRRYGELSETQPAVRVRTVPNAQQT